MREDSTVLQTIYEPNNRICELNDVSIELIRHLPLIDTGGE